MSSNEEKKTMFVTQERAIARPKPVGSKKKKTRALAQTVLDAEKGGLANLPR